MAKGRPGKDSKEVLVKSAELIGWALGGLEREIAQTRDRLAALNAKAAQLRATIGRRASSKGSAVDEPHTGRRQRRRQMSADARKRISEMMKKRWAERRKAGD